VRQEYAKFFPTDPPTRAVAKLGVELPNVLVSWRGGSHHPSIDTSDSQGVKTRQ